MAQVFPISVEEEKAIADLGGFDRVVAIADRIPGEHNIQRSLFPEHERRHIRQGRSFVKREN